MVAKFTNYLKTNGLKVTKRRIAVLECLNNSKSPVDVEEIIKFCRSKKIRVDPVTVYRILNIFLTHNIIQKTEFDEGKFRYELKETTHHHHAVCTKCGSIKDIGNCRIEEMEKSFTKKMSFLVDSHRLEFFGLCTKCHD